MADQIDTPRHEDLYSVGSRISWGAVLAGAVVTLALYLVMTLLGAAIGLTVDVNTPVERLAPWAMAWSVLAACLSLFAGGCVATQLTAGETRTEAMMHGVILWGAVVGMMLWLAASGVSAGFNAMLNIAYAGEARGANREIDWQAAARRAGVPQETIDRWRETANNDENTTQREADRRRLGAMVTWSALFGTLLSMGAAIGGALFGAGPTTRHIFWPASAGRRTEARHHVHV